MSANESHNHHQIFDVSINVPPQIGSKCFDDDGRLKRTGTIWTASAHIITAVIGSGVLSLAWATAQLGWIAACYRCGDPDNGERNYTYMEAVRANLGGFQVKVCGAIQYLNLFGVAIGYTIAASISMMAIERSNCLGIAKVAETGKIRGSLTGISIGTVTEMDKIWRSFQALGAIAFAYSYSLILIEIQDTIKSPPSQYKTMKKATLLSVAIFITFTAIPVEGVNPTPQNHNSNIVSMPYSTTCERGFEEGHMQGPQGDMEDDIDFNDSENDISPGDNDMLFEKNV
ncbi:unnamed protein product [Fraxinus pennsylvanica]|uniref:Amino acid transporter transmembrane domain-containing protein n=1 Tax=Fraxinus pennsylvanica TaxID=56036 RepID=A0AAD2AEI5_9LAMI|nr:unnamed protein product [Fraxinus pennsylvanica]